MKKVRKIKIKHYSKEVLKYLLLAGVVYVAASSPSFALGLMKRIFRPKQKFPREKAIDSFNYLKRRRLIEIEREGHDVCIALTMAGKRQAGKYQIDDLEIEKPKKWDKKWRVVIFDVPTFSRTIRDAFRKKLKEFGFYALQKSIWAFPYPCEEEIKILREFFGLDNKQIQVLEVIKLEDDKPLKKFFKI